MLHPTRFSRAFTLIEMLVVMAVIAILAGIILSVNGLVQSKAARTRAQAEIVTLSAGCESYKGDNGSYPQDAATDADTMDPRKNGLPSSYTGSSTLYKALSGDSTPADGRTDIGAKNYLPDFFTPQRVGASYSIKDPYGNSYGYSTAGAKAEQDYVVKVKANANEPRPTTPKGFNTTFDLWSTAGKTASPIPADLGKPRDVINTWVKNW
jgi:prepilin-type N-terminal cleavage/methylation domain-containing protein